MPGNQGSALLAAIAGFAPTRTAQLVLSRLLGAFVGQLLLQFGQDRLADLLDGFFYLLQRGVVVGIVFFELLAKALGHLVNEGLAVGIWFHDTLRRMGLP